MDTRRTRCICGDPAVDGDYCEACAADLKARDRQDVTCARCGQTIIEGAAMITTHGGVTTAICQACQTPSDFIA